jgi:hypothetical protein
MPEFSETPGFVPRLGSYTAESSVRRILLRYETNVHQLSFQNPSNPVAPLDILAQLCFAFDRQSQRP